MICKICHLNKTDSTSGICWRCLSENYVYKIIKHKTKNNHPYYLSSIWVQYEELQNLLKKIN